MSANDPFAPTDATRALLSSVGSSPVRLHGVCFVTHFDEWKHVSRGSNADDPEYPVWIPDRFQGTPTFMLSSTRVDTHLGPNVWWKRLGEHSARVWTNGSFEGFYSNWKVRGDSVSGNVSYFHDVGGETRAVLKGIKVGCPPTTQGVIVAYLWTDPP